MPSSVGYQDLAGMSAQPRGAAPQSGEHLMASPFGTIEAATFSYGRPIGTAMPAPPSYQLVSFDPSSPEATSWRIDAPLAAHAATEVEYPRVNRRLKGDRLPVLQAAPPPSPSESLPQLQPVDAPATMQPLRPAPSAPVVLPPLKSSQPQTIAPPALPILPLATATDDDVPPLAQPAQMPPEMPVLQFSDAAPTVDTPASVPAPVSSAPDQDSAAAEPPPEPAMASDADDNQSSSLAAMSFIDDDAAQGSRQTFFGAVAMGTASGLESWAPGDEPVPSLASGPSYRLASYESSASDADSAGNAAISKGEGGALLESPAERLQLSGRPRERAEKCLADAVYFEARGEPRKGQEAVAQVVMNRVFSGYYPKNVCGVVFQNANRHLACQFTFACEGKDLSRIDEPDMWEQAKEIAKDTLDGKIWLPDVAHATHYHAYWVHPSWVHEMTRVLKLGVHTFYRPRAWGDGDDEPVWGKAPSADAGKPADAAKGPQAAASPLPSGRARTARL